MSVGDVEQVFDPAAFVEAELVTYGLLDDHVVCLLRGQNLVDVLRRSHCVHLISLQGEKQIYQFMFFLSLSEESLISLTSSVLLSRSMSEYSGKLVTAEPEHNFTAPSS